MVSESLLIVVCATYNCKETTTNILLLSFRMLNHITKNKYLASSYEEAIGSNSDTKL